jgi:hypothetical protein
LSRVATRVINEMRGINRVVRLHLEAAGNDRVEVDLEFGSLPGNFKAEFAFHCSRRNEIRRCQILRGNA